MLERGCMLFAQLCHCQAEQRNLIKGLVETPCLMEKLVEHLRVIRAWRWMNELCLGSVLKSFIICAPCLENYPCCSFCDDIAGVYVNLGIPFFIARVCVIWTPDRRPCIFACVILCAPSHLSPSPYGLVVQVQWEVPCPLFPSCET